MGKKVLKRKKSTFVLEPDGFSIHTFELSYELTASEFDRMKNEAYQEKMLYRDENTRITFAAPDITRKAYGCGCTTSQPTPGITTIFCAWSSIQGS